MESVLLDQDDASAEGAEALPQAPPPSFGQTLFAPLWIHRPAVAASRMVRGSRLAFWLSYGLGVLTLAGVILFLNMWDRSVERIPGPYWRLEDRTFAEVWEAMHANGSFVEAEWTMILVCLLTVPVTLLAAFLYLPNAHNGGSAGRAFRRAFAAVASGIGLLNLLVLLAGGLIVIVSNRSDRRMEAEKFDVMGAIILCHACVAVLLYWLHRATRSVAGPRIKVQLPPRCEGCGYDLTHQSTEGLCTECGLDLDASLTPDLRRPGSAWQTRPNDQGWLAASVSLIVRPRRFYGRLKLRTPPDEDAKFARWHYGALGVFGGAGCLLLILIAILKYGGGPPPIVFCGAPIIFLFLVPLVCWGVKHLVGALVTSWCVAFESLADTSWMKKIIACETAYLWVFCFYTAALGLSFILFDTWMTRLAAAYVSPLFRRVPAEFLAILFGNILIGLGWFWRYRIAIQRVRWSNF